MSIESTILAVAQPLAGATQETKKWTSAERRSSELYGKFGKFRTQVVSVFPDGEFKAEMSDGWFIRYSGLPKRLSRELPSEVGAFFKPECRRQPGEIEFLVKISPPTLTDASLELRVKRDGVGQCLIDITVSRHRPGGVFIVPHHKAEERQTEAAQKAMEAIRALNTGNEVEDELARIKVAEEIFVFAEREFERARPSKK